MGTLDLKYKKDWVSYSYYIVEYIEDNYPNNVNFVVDNYTINIIAKGLRENRYENILYSFGIRFLLSILEFFIKEEEYEKCSKIVEEIQIHNSCFKSNLPTSLTK